MQDDPVIPLFLSLYQESPAASLFITNEEPAEIRDVRVSFTAGEFTTSEFICGIIPLIAKGHTMELPLLADFSPDLLNFTENGRVVGELTIRYTLLGQERRTVKSAAVDIYRRNSFRWIDPAGAAAFVSPTAPEILEYAKLVTSLSNSRRRTGLNGPMQNALALFEGLLAAGFRCTPDVTTPYREFRIDPEKVDSIQFPFETLRYRSGDVDDIGVLLAEALEAAGVHTAFISLEDDFIVALSLNTTEAGASAFFNNNAKLVIAGDRAWMPLAMSAFNGGFINSWEAGAAAVDRHIKAGKDFNFVTLEDAWRSYPPLAPPSQGVRPPVPAEAAMNAAIDQALRRYTASELTPKITQINAQIQQGATGALYNQLGTAYLRCAMLREARDAFERAARLNYAPGMNNRGNLALMDKDLAAAERWFNQALAVDAENAAALRGLQQVKNQRDD
jgi:tetratricopeptide (TPR) repeat protein